MIQNSHMQTSRFFIIICLLSITLVVNSQQNAGMFGRVNIASPNAAALGKYGDIPVNNHTGIPSISIPLYTLKEGSLSVPVSLSYHASGLRVEENASWVGAGWSLNAGGVITRTVKDKPDERRTQSLQQEYGHLSNGGFVNCPLFSTSKSTTHDLEPDLFSFNFNGYSGKFYFDDSKHPVLSVEQDIKIEYVYKDELWTSSPGYNLPGGIGKSIESFILTTPDGNRYFFGIPNTPIPPPYTVPVEVTSSYTSSSGMLSGKVISSWYLYKIVSADGNSVIDFFYTPDKYAYFTYPGVTYGQGSSNSNAYFAVKNFMSGVQLSRVSGTVNRIDFVPTFSARLDLSRWQTGLDEGSSDNVNNTSKALASVRIHDTGSNCLKKFDFNYSYFEDNVTPNLSYFTGIETDRKRLRLNSITESSCDGTIVLPPYQFDYFSEPVPRRMSFGKDHWGFINGISTNTQLFPEVFDNNGSLNSKLSLSVSNRESSWPAMRAGTIKRITYPTGGYTDFDFEPHSVFVGGQNRMVGGIRIKSIINNDPATGSINKTDFEYKRAGSEISSGKLFSKPFYIQILRNDWWVKSLVNSKGCPLLGYDNQIMPREYVLSDNTIRPMETTQGNHIGYEVVRIKKGHNGSSVYVYNVGSERSQPQNNLNTNKLIINHINSPGICDISIPNYPAVPIANIPGRGDLNSEVHFDQQGSLIQEKIYTSLYQESNSSVPGLLYYQLPYENNLPLPETIYELRSFKKIESSVIERNYDLIGGKTEKVIRNLSESKFHNSPTRSIHYNNFDDSLVTKNIYAFDLSGSLVSSISSCNNASANFLSFFNSSFYDLGYAQALQTLPPGNPTLRGQKLLDFIQYVATNRSNYSACLINKRKQAEQLIDQVMVNADSKLKPILWLKQINKNSLLESSEWKNNQLVKSSFFEYTNKRDDSLGVYPINLNKIELSVPSNTFTPVTINGNRFSVTIDSRYATHTRVNYLEGNQVNIQSRDGISVSNSWGYRNEFPVVAAINASNMQRDTSLIALQKITIPFCLGTSCGTNIPPTATFYHMGGEKITLSIGQPPPGNKMSAIFYLTGPDNVTNAYHLCFSTNPQSTCQTNPSVIELPNMPKGQYKLEIVVSTTSSSFTFYAQAFYEFLGKTIKRVGEAEYFYEGFEEQINSGIVFNNSFTGLKSYNGSYIPPFQPPNNRSYIIQWWKFENSKWNFNQQQYQQGMVLNGLIDEVRILPVDAQMTTYNYDYRYGLINVCDINNRKTTYVYDRLGRLLHIKDHDGNILKSFEYQYKAGQ